MRLRSRASRGREASFDGRRKGRDGRRRAHIHILTIITIANGSIENPPVAPSARNTPATWLNSVRDDLLHWSESSTCVMCLWHENMSPKRNEATAAIVEYIMVVYGERERERERGEQPQTSARDLLLATIAWPHRCSGAQLSWTASRRGSDDHRRCWALPCSSLRLVPDGSLRLAVSDFSRA